MWKGKHPTIFAGNYYKECFRLIWHSCRGYSVVLSAYKLGSVNPWRQPPWSIKEATFPAWSFLALIYPLHPFQDQARSLKPTCTCRYLQIIIPVFDGRFKCPVFMNIPQWGMFMQINRNQLVAFTIVIIPINQHRLKPGPEAVYLLKILITDKRGWVGFLPTVL